MAMLAPGDRLLDVASGSGTSALLAAREFEASVTGIDYGERAVAGATAAAKEEPLQRQVTFAQGDAEALAFPEDSFDAVLCECSLCTFPNQERAVAEIARVLRPGGRGAIADVVIDAERLPRELLGPMATIACVGSALTAEGYVELLAGAGLRVFAVEDRAADAASLVERIEERLRAARLLGLGGVAGSPIGVDEAIALAGVASRAIADGALGYSIFAASD